MDHESLVRDRELVAPGFVRDLRVFLNLSPNSLLTIAEIGGGPDGFMGAPQFRNFSERGQVPMTEARSALRIATYLYDRVTELGIEIDEAAAQIVAVASSIADPIEVDEDRKEAISQILAFKLGHETAHAAGLALENGPHFMRLSGSWMVKRVPLREGEPLQIPVLNLSIGWHDGAGANHEAFVQMSPDDWAEFRDAVDKIHDDLNSMAD